MYFWSTFFWVKFDCGNTHTALDRDIYIKERLEQDTKVLIGLLVSSYAVLKLSILNVCGIFPVRCRRSFFHKGCDIHEVCSGNELSHIDFSMSLSLVSRRVTLVVVFGFCPRILGGGCDLRMLFCHYVGWVIGTLRGGYDTQTLSAVIKNIWTFSTHRWQAKKHLTRSLTSCRARATWWNFHKLCTYFWSFNHNKLQTPSWNERFDFETFWSSHGRK